MEKEISEGIRSKLLVEISGMSPELYKMLLISKSDEQLQEIDILIFLKMNDKGRRFRTVSPFWCPYQAYFFDWISGNITPFIAVKQHQINIH